MHTSWLPKILKKKEKHGDINGFRAVTMTVVRDRKQILPAPGTNQNAGFGGYRPLAH